MVIRKKEREKEIFYFFFSVPLLGMETASYLVSDNRSASVVVIGSTSAPFERTLGSAVGQRIQKWFEDNGVVFKNSAKVSKLEGTDKVEGVS